ALMPASGSVARDALPTPPAWANAHLLAVQWPMPGQQGAPYFTGSEISEFLRGWERMVTRFKLSAEEKVENIVEYCDLDTRRSMKVLVRMAAREVRGEEEGTKKEKQWDAPRKLALERY